MKLAMVVFNSYFMDRVMAVLKENGIDYYTSWDGAKGKGHGTEPHLGAGAFASTNSVVMIAFQDEAPLAALISGIEAANGEIRRPSDRIRMFQMPLERIV
ncbi:MAG: PG0541 family transporter-associated protein [Burkholderiales bacterium]